MSSTHFDLVIKNGLVVSEQGSKIQDIGISGSTIKQVGGSLTGEVTIDAQGHYVLPGGIDAHVHLSAPSDPSLATASWSDDFYIGSLAAIAGGVTTFGNMTFPWAGQTLLEAIERDAQDAKKLAAIDYFIHPVLEDPSDENIAAIASFKELGIASLKVFLVDESFTEKEASYFKAFNKVQEAGVLLLLHCEDPELISAAIAELALQDQLSLAHWSESRPIAAEVKSIEKALEICRSTGASIYIVHLSSELALDAAVKGKTEGLPVYVEVRPMYLHLTKEKLKLSDGAKYIGAPPLRDVSDSQALWAGLSSGAIDLVASDHAPFTLEDKLDATVDVRSARQGVSDLETSLPMLFSRGVSGGRISLERFVEITSSAPAKIFGIFDQKGSIEVGKDADIVIWDPLKKQQINAQQMKSHAGYSVYEGTETTGAPITTISRGEILMRDGALVAEPGRGRWVKTP